MTHGATLGVRRNPDRGAPAYLAAVLRGVGQVGLQPHLATGGLLLAALWLAGPWTGLSATLGTLASTTTAYALGADRDAVSRGLHGYSGCLTGLALLGPLGPNPATYALTVLGGALCSVLTAALTALLAPHGLPPLTAPFCLVAGSTLLAAPAFARLPADPAVNAPPGGGPGPWWHGFLAAFSQVFLLDDQAVGLLVLLALALAGRRALLGAALGSATGTLTAWALGAPTGRIADGGYGCNAVLVGTALGALLLTGAPRLRGTGYLLLGAATATVLTAALAPLGGPVLTWPFVLTTWALTAAAPHLPGLRPAPG